MFFSVAIFSQLKKETSLSFKNLDPNDLIRIVPFKLPKKIELNLTKFMKNKALNTTSFDLIYGKDKKFYFLESNPVGQFNWVSELANYYLEKKLSKILVQ